MLLLLIPATLYTNHSTNSVHCAATFSTMTALPKTPVYKALVAYLTHPLRSGEGGGGLYSKCALCPATILTGQYAQRLHQSGESSSTFLCNFLIPLAHTTWILQSHFTCLCQHTTSISVNPLQGLCQRLCRALLTG
jgi:hypothetical protein